MTLKETLDEVYKLGYKNGAVEMKDKVLKGINKEIRFFTTKNETIAKNPTMLLGTKDK